MTIISRRTASCGWGRYGDINDSFIKKKTHLTIYAAGAVILEQYPSSNWKKNKQSSSYLKPITSDIVVKIRDKSNFTGQKFSHTKYIKYIIFIYLFKILMLLLHYIHIYTYFNQLWNVTSECWTLIRNWKIMWGSQTRYYYKLIYDVMINKIIS